MAALAGAPLVSLASLALIFATCFPYRSSYGTFGSMITSELGNFFTLDLLTGALLIAGAHAWIVWRDLESEHRAAALEQQLVGATLVSGDLGDGRVITRMFDETMAAYGRVDIVVNNAGRTSGSRWWT